MNTKRDVCCFKITLRDVSPAVWRRIEVPAKYTFWDLHVAIQDAMGWVDYHLHLFRVANARGKLCEIGIPDDDPFQDDPVVLAGWTIPIADYFSRVGASAQYDYDFGDGWVHDVRLESISPRSAKTKYPRCVAGARRCPPEDCGGPHGYENLLTIVANPRHKEYKETLEWLGGPFDPTVFDPAKVRFDNPAKRWKIAFADAEAVSSSAAHEAMDSYDPDRSPVAADWLALDEGERMELVDDFHRRARIRVPKQALHTVIHVIVENQLALGVDTVVAAMTRLQAEGVDRHEAIHAVGSVFITSFHEQLTVPVPDLNAVYGDRLAALTAARFRDGEV
ncbi:MAG: plasmid pRiA4b ORF-3 family protein [Gemmatimonadaceae bacterium]